MFMSQSEFNKLLNKNPQLKVQVPALLVRSDKDLSPKYWNVKVFVFEDGFVSEDKTLRGHGKIIDKFDSRREYRRWIELRYLEMAKKIKNLRKQVRFEIQPAFVCGAGNERVSSIYYIADFEYIETESNAHVVEDVKALDEKTGKYRYTQAFSLKWKLLKYKYPNIHFRIT